MGMYTLQLLTIEFKCLFHLKKPWFSQTTTCVYFPNFKGRGTFGRCDLLSKDCFCPVSFQYCASLAGCQVTELQHLSEVLQRTSPTRYNLLFLCFPPLGAQVMWLRICSFNLCPAVSKQGVPRIFCCAVRPVVWVGESSTQTSHLLPNVSPRNAFQQQELCFSSGRCRSASHDWQDRVPRRLLEDFPV